MQAAIGAKYTAEELGGAKMHAQISGTVDYREPDDESYCVIRSLVTRWKSPAWHLRCGIPSPRYDAGEIYGIFDSDGAKQYDMKEIIARIVDDSHFDEYRPEYGETVICGFARIGGFAVGIVANQKTHVNQTDRSGNKRVEFGGVIYTESAEKAARFIMDCNQNIVPLLFLHDVNGFMVGRDAEWSGIIRAGAKMVNAVSNSVVPKITVIVGGSFGAGHYAMCGKAYDPRFVFAWPTAKYAVMGGAAAANTLVEIKIKQLERGGKKLSEEDKKKLYDEVKATYDEQMDPRYGAARLWIDKIIDPVETRDAIITALEAASLNPELPRLAWSIADVADSFFPMFVDEAKIRIKAGDGGNGCMAFRREKFVPRGGPSGGDGGRGGDVIMESSERHNTLVHFRFNPEYKAERGRHGEGSNKTGREGDDVVLSVPVGTVVYDELTSELVHDFSNPDDRVVIAHGGRGGRGNARFATSVHQAPREHEQGFPGEERNLRLELKLLADVGLVGYPNAGKSTLISRISAARPKSPTIPSPLCINLVWSLSATCQMSAALWWPILADRRRKRGGRPGHAVPAPHRAHASAGSPGRRV